MATLKIGDTPRRVEDARFLTGAGCYVDDMQLENMAHAVVLRSPHAHADVKSVDTSTAKAASGVLAVLTGADLDAAGIGPLQPYEQVNVYSDEPFSFPTQYPLAKERVRYAGEPVALVIAESHSAGLDATELIDVDYAPLPALIRIEAALNSGDAENICLEWSVGDQRAANVAFEAAAHVTRLDIRNHRNYTHFEPRFRHTLHAV